MERILSATEVAILCKVKIGKAYQIIRILNSELEKEGFIIIRGRVPKNYLLQRLGIEVE